MCVICSCQYLGVGDEVAQPHALPTAVSDFHVGHDEPIDGRPAARFDPIGES